MHGICKWQDNTLSNVMYNSRLQHITNIKVRTLTGDRSGHAKGHMLTYLHIPVHAKREITVMIVWMVFLLKKIFSLEV